MRLAMNVSLITSEIPAREEDEVDSRCLEGPPTIYRKLRMNRGCRADLGGDEVSGRGR